MQDAPILLLIAVLGILASARGQTPAPAPAPASAPAPAPAPGFINVTQLLVYGGAYSTFISLLQETKVDVIFQGMANNSQSGITIFAPSDAAFQTKLVTTALKNLTASQKVSLVEYHALNNYQSLEDLQNSNDNQTATVATYNNGGGRYLLNITFAHGLVQVISDWTTANLSSMVFSQDPVSIFAVDEVLLPSDLVGLPSPAPAVAPSVAVVGSPITAPPPSLSNATPPTGSSSNRAPPSSTPSSIVFCSLLISFLPFALLVQRR